MKGQFLTAAMMAALFALPANAQEGGQCVLNGVTHAEHTNINDEMRCVGGQWVKHRPEPREGLTDMPKGAYGGGSSSSMGGILADACSRVPCYLH